MNDKKTYHTRQQKVIVDFITEHAGEYVTVSQIAAHLKEKEQPVGLTTIYRQMDKLEKDGIVHKIVLDGKSGAFYQYAGKDVGGLLLKCENCGGIIPMDCSHMEDLYQHVLQEHQFRVNPYRTMFYGVCDACMKIRNC